MRVLKLLTVAACAAAPLVLIQAPAEALTARQQAALGQGVYLTSKGIPEGYSYPRHYGYPAYGYRPGYGYGRPRHYRRDWNYGD